MPKTQQLKAKVYLEDAFTPVNDAKIKLILLDIKDSTKPKDESQEQISKNGEAIFTLANNINQFEFEVSDERFYRKVKNNVVRATNNTISLNLSSKLRLYFNEKELYINNGNQAIDYFRAYSGKALSIKEKAMEIREREYELKAKKYEVVVLMVKPSILSPKIYDTITQQDSLKDFIMQKTKESLKNQNIKIESFEHIGRFAIFETKNEQ